MLSSQLWDLSRERAITNERTAKERVWGLQLTVPVRAPMRVFNKTSSEARVTTPKLSPSVYSWEKSYFFPAPSHSSIKITCFVCVFVMLWHVEGIEAHNWKVWCQLIKSL